MLYLTVWDGEETDWITVTPQHHDDADSSQFDEGVCTGFKVPQKQTRAFITDFLVLANKYGIVVNVV